MFHETGRETIIKPSPQSIKIGRLKAESPILKINMWRGTTNKIGKQKISPKPETSPTPIPWDCQRNAHTPALSVPNWRTSIWHPLLLFCKCACHVWCCAAVKSSSVPHSCNSGSEQMLSQERKKCFQDWKLKLIFIILCSLGSSIMMKSWRFSGSFSLGDLILLFFPR